MTVFDVESLDFDTLPIALSTLRDPVRIRVLSGWAMGLVEEATLKGSSADDHWTESLNHLSAAMAEGNLAFLPYRREDGGYIRLVLNDDDENWIAAFMVAQRDFEGAFYDDGRLYIRGSGMRFVLSEAAA